MFCGPISGRTIRAVERRLFGAGQRFNFGFEGLVILAFELQLGLQFFYQQLEARDFGLKLLRA